MSRDEIADVLASVRLFRGAEAAFFRHVAQQPRARRWTQPDEPVFDTGDPADAVFVAFPADAAAAGPRSVVALTLPTGEGGLQAHVEHVVAGDAFGEFELVAAGLANARTIRRSSARTLVACDLYRIPYSAVIPLAAESEAVRGRLIRLSMERLISALSVRSTHLLGDKDIALANWLLDAADNLGIAEGRHVRFSRPVGQREIAEALGVTRETISLRLNEWERAGLLNTGGQSQRFEILDYPRIALRAAIRKHNAHEAIEAALAEIDADLDHGELVRARNVALDMLVFFPTSPELRHRAALASIRAGSVREAVDILAQGGYATDGDLDLLRHRTETGLRHPAASPGRLFFGAAEPLDEEQSGEDIALRVPTLVEDIAAIEARARKEMAFAAADADGRRRHAGLAARYYANVFAATGGHYAAINAALMARIAGNEAEAEAFARRIVADLGSDLQGYWPNATVGEAHLLLGEAAAALRSFAAASGQGDASDGKRSSTRVQLGRIGERLAMPVGELLRALPVGGVAVYGGHARAADGDEIRSRVEAVLKAENIRYAFGGLAPGVEILVAEAALAAGCELHVVLPCPVEAFMALARPKGTSGDWAERFRSCLARSTALTAAVEHPPAQRALPAYRAHALQLASGQALLKADMLTATCTMLVAAGEGAVMPSSTRRGWSAAGRPIIDLAPAPEPFEDDGGGAPGVFAPVVFVWSTDGEVDLAGLIRGAEAATGGDLVLLPRLSRDRRPGTAIVLPDIGAALDVLDSLARRCRRDRMPVRIVGDFGPVFDAKNKVSESMVSRLAGASDLIGFPAATPVATLPFAAHVRLGAADRAAIVPIGRTAPDPAARGRPLAAREVYALALGEAIAVNPFLEDVPGSKK